MSPRAWARHVGVAIMIFVTVAAVAACAGDTPPPAPAAAKPLRILLVNDSGWSSPGITTLYETLRAAGHQVAVVAPSSDQSQAGTSTTLSRPVSLRHPTRDQGVWVTSGTPADGALLGIQGLFGYPDLVISGIDDSYNVTLSAMSSGTIGAALTVATHNVPAIAVSTEVADPRRATRADFTPTAAFVARLVATLQARRPAGAQLMPTEMVLNVNHPRGREPARGVVAAATSSGPAMTVTYRPGRKPDELLPIATPNGPTGLNDDVTALARREITLTDMSADPDRSAPPSRVAAVIAPLLEP